jgi:NADH:ubiquinone oxidoreductase subunit 4 (subunit M)
VPVETFRTFMVIAAVGTVLAAGYLLWLLQRTAFGTPSEEFADDPHIHDASRLEYVAWLPMLALIVVLGVYPNLLFKTTDDAVIESLHPCLSIAEDDPGAADCAEVYDLAPLADVADRE